MNYTTLTKISSPYRIQNPFSTLFNIPLSHLEKQPPLGKWQPPLTVQDLGDRLKLELEAGGMKKEDFDITLHEDQLTIHGKRENQEPTETYLINERPSGTFQRTLLLPHPIRTENIQAQYKEGVLHLTLLKTEETQPKKIPISGA